MDPVGLGGRSSILLVLRLNLLNTSGFHLSGTHLFDSDLVLRAFVGRQQRTCLTQDGITSSTLGKCGSCRGDFVLSDRSVTSGFEEHAAGGNLNG